MRKKLDTSLWSRENIAWVAGVLEGEGCFPLNEAVSHCHIVLQMTDRDVVERVAAICGTGKVSVLTKKFRPHHKDVWRWKVGAAAHVYAICVAIFPFMLSRRAGRIADMIRAFRDRGPRLNRIHGTLAKYKRGCRCDPCRLARREYRPPSAVKKASVVLQMGTRSP